VLLGQVPTATQFAGGALIVAGVSLVRVDELKTPDAPPLEAVAVGG
jgi:drug/metabolite transporter (DMT)-like permease